MTRRNIQGVPFWLVRCRILSAHFVGAVPSQETESAESISRRRETTKYYFFLSLPPTHIVYILYIYIYIAYVPVCTYKMCYMCYYHHYYGYPYFYHHCHSYDHESCMYLYILNILCSICLKHLKSSDLGMNKTYYYIGMYIYILYIYISYI